MKNKKKYIRVLLLLVLLVSLSGCTKVLKNSENRAIVNEETGQSVTENIICQPENEEIRKLYEENNVDLNTYPRCSDINITGEYEDIWTNIFVRPLSFAIIKVGSFVKSNILAIVIITLLIRFILYPVTKKTAMQSELMKKAQPEISKIEQKYADKTDQESMNKKNQEMLMTYQKYKINPLSGCIFSLIQLPLLFAFLEAINRTPAIFEETIFGGVFTLEMGKTTWTALTQGQYQYIVITLIIIFSTYLSFKMNKSMETTGQAKQQKIMMIFMVGLISIMSFTLPTAIGIYWIISSGFTIFQNFITDRKKKNEKD